MVMANKEVAFLREAHKHGQIELVKRYGNENYFRCSVILNNETRFVNISDRLWIDLNWPDFMEG